MTDFPKKCLSFGQLIKGFNDAWVLPKDGRRQKSVHYSIRDAVLSGLACMFYKSGSMLAFQNRMHKTYHKNNLQTQFGILKTPKDNRMRELVAIPKPESFRPVFKDYLQRLQRMNYLKHYQVEGRYLLTIDGTEYYRSTEVSCPCCLETESRGITSYTHKVVQPIISHPDLKQILPLMPEEICHHDGDTKQDSEINASKRLLDNIRTDHPRMRVIVMGDALYANKPFIDKVRERDDKFIFRVKTGSHKYLHEAFDKAKQHTKEIVNDRGVRLIHKWSSGQLHKGTDIDVTVMRLYTVSTDKKGRQKSTLVGTWATDVVVDQDNIVEMVKAARARWKVENEAFNCLKNDGYNLTHNWGHVNGESFNFYILVLLGFYLHQILELSDQLYKKCRSMAHAAYALWEELRVLFNRFLYDSWEALLQDFLRGFKTPSPPV